MAGRLSFSIAINLLTENFKRGTNQVKTALRSMQMQFLTFAAALGAGGLGLSGFVSQLITVARETSRVTTALKNVSGSMLQFADNQRFLLDMANKYGLEINALTGNYAKFTAASQVSGMSMENQRKIFESMSRACTAFGMSADDSNGVFLALSQMMSKGKISSEELRLQMGERLPIALQAMAKAAGVSVGGLDKLMKQGKLMSADVLPKFADAINEMIPNVDTDNLETSVNRLKNAFTDFVNGTDAQSKYKSLIDGLTGAVKSAANNIKSIITYTVAAILVMITSRLVNKIIGSIARAELAAKVAARRAAAAAGVAFDEAAWRAQKASDSIRMAFTKALGSLKSLFISSIPTAVIAILGAVIAKMITMHQEANRIKRIFSDVLSESKNAGSSPELVKLQKLYEIATNLKGNLEARKGALNEINKLLGTSYSIDEKTLGIQGDLNKKYAERVSLLKAAAEVDYFTQKKLDLEDKIKTVQTKAGTDLKDALPDMSKSVNPLAKNFSPSALWNGPIGVKTLFNMTPWGISGDNKNVSNELRELQKSLFYVDKRLEISLGAAADTSGGKTYSPTNDPDGDKKDKKTDIQKAEEEYATSLQTYKNQLDVGAITQEKYNEEVDSLNKNTVSKIGGILGKSAEANVTYAEALRGTLNPLVTNEAKAKAELAKVEEEYKNATELAKAKLDKKIITENEYRQSLIDAATAAANSAISIENIGDAADGFIKKIQGVVGDNLKIDMPKLKQRDATFDYKKTKTDKTSEELDVWIEYRDNLKDKLKETKDKTSDVAKSLEIELNGAIANVDDLGKALKLSQVQEDIKNFSKELNQMEWDGFKGAVSNIDGMVSAFQRLQDAFDPESEATEWERLMAVWNMMTSVVDGMMSIIKTIEGITELTNKLTQAKDAEIVKTVESNAVKVTEATVDTTVTGVKVANSQIKKTADTSEAATAVTTATTEVAANTAKGVSAAGSSAASLPFPANIIAIGGAIAAAIALFAMIPKFATGGIVGGNSPSGDKVLARLNSGEMVLNKGQQSRLGEAIDSARNSYSTRVVVGGSVEVRGDKMELAINNSRRKQGKKPIS